MRLPWIGLMSATALTASSILSLAAAEAVAPKAVVAHYAATAEAMYGDALSAANDLQKAVDALIAVPSDATLRQATDVLEETLRTRAVEKDERPGR